MWHIVHDKEAKDYIAVNFETSTHGSWRSSINTTAKEALADPHPVGLMYNSVTEWVDKTFLDLTIITSTESLENFERDYPEHLI